MVEKNNVEKLPIVFPKQELPFEVTHHTEEGYYKGCERTELAEHILVEEF